MKNINFITKLKTEPKFRKNVIAVTATALVLVICAVSIPVGLHVRKSDVQKTAENITASVTEATTLTVDAKEISTTEPTTLTAVVSETVAVSASPTQKQNNKTGTGDNGSPSSSSNKTNNQSKPTTTKAPSTTKKPRKHRQMQGQIIGQEHRQMLSLQNLEHTVKALVLFGMIVLI